MEVFLSLAPVYVIVIVAFLLKRFKVLAADTSKYLTPIFFKIVTPALIFLTLAETYFEFSSLLLIGLGLSALAIYIAVFTFAKRFGITSEKTQLAALLSGIHFAVGSVAYPLVKTSFPLAVFAEVVIIDLTMFISFLAFAPILVSNQKDTKRIVDLLTKDPIVLSVYLGVLWSIFRFPLPEIAMHIIQFPASGFSFIAALILGLSISIPSLKQFKRVAVISGIKIMVWVLLSILIWFLPLPLTTKQAIILCISAPTGLFPTIYAEKYGLDKEFAAQMAIVTTFIMVLAYPALIALIS